MTEYRWKKRSSLPVEAQAAGERLEQLRVTNNGHLTPRAVVDDARPEDALLHPAFEWDDAVAAEAYREDQARYVIRSVVAVVEKGGNEQSTVRAFLSVKEDNDQHYTSLAVAMSDEDKRQQVLRRAWKELQSWHDRYSEYEELAAIFQAIEASKQEALAG